MLPSAVPDRHYFTENDERECGAGPMPSVEIEARNAVDGRIYRAVIVPKRQSIDYVTQPAIGEFDALAKSATSLFSSSS